MKAWKFAIETQGINQNGGGDAHVSLTPVLKKKTKDKSLDMSFDFHIFLKTTSIHASNSHIVSPMASRNYITW